MNATMYKKHININNLKALIRTLSASSFIALSALSLSVGSSFSPHTYACCDFGPLPPDAFEEDVEEALEEALEEELADGLESGLEEELEDRVEEDVEELAEQNVEDEIEDTVEQSLEESLEGSIEESLESDIEESIADTVDDAVEGIVEESVEEEVAEAVEDSVEEEVAETVEDSVEQSVAYGVEQDVESNVEQSVEEVVADSVEDRLEGEIDQIMEQLETGLEIDEKRIHKEQWLVMAGPRAFEELADRGYIFDEITNLPGLGLMLAEVAAPSSFDIGEVRAGVVDVVGKDRAEVDINHIYTAGAPITVPFEEGIYPREALAMPADIDTISPRIGMIDSKVNLTHPALSAASIQSRTFTAKGSIEPEDHGTAIASILVGRGENYSGLAPQSRIYAASVFEQDEELGEIANTVSLLRALDWLVSSEIEVVNLSLAGPANKLLEAALKRARLSGTIVFAAAGNGGPIALPMYPAAYDSVVAVTAVDSGGHIFRLANRGGYLDIAAPGVSVMHANSKGGYSSSSGTSFAVPFAVTAAARMKMIEPGVDPVDALYRSAIDLGIPGKDDIYGFGLVQLMRKSS